MTKGEVRFVATLLVSASTTCAPAKLIRPLRGFIYYSTDLRSCLHYIQRSHYHQFWQNWSYRTPSDSPYQWVLIEVPSHLMAADRSISHSWQFFAKNFHSFFGTVLNTGHVIVYGWLSISHNSFRRLSITVWQHMGSSPIKMASQFTIYLIDLLVSQQEQMVIFLNEPLINFESNFKSPACKAVETQICFYFIPMYLWSTG